jgi:hypothetical protein
MSTKLVHLFDANGLYRVDCECAPNPQEPGQFIEPINSTAVALPVLTANETARFVSGAWVVVPDFRGQFWYDQTSGAAVEIVDVGQPATNLAATPPPPTLQQARTEAGLKIDGEAGAARARYITTVPGQSETYMSKAADAAAYKAAAYPFASLASYVWVQAEAVAINGASPTSAQVKAAADSILAAQAGWVALGANIEQARRAGAVAVAAASTVAAVQAAQAAAIATLQGM